MKQLRIGMVSPYGWDTPGGVQVHIKELAENFIEKGHHVSVIAPVSDESLPMEEWLVNAGRPLSVPFNGAVAKVLFGPLATSRVRQWIAQGDFDVLHIHEPVVPSLSLLACWSAEGPMVATFHASSPKQKALSAVGPILEPVLEKLGARIAVSEMARKTLTDHFTTDAVIIPNGINNSHYRDAIPNPAWSGPHTLGFLGRFDENRKGLDVLLKALPQIVKKYPDTRLLVAGPGDAEAALKKMDASLRSRVHFLGRLTDVEKQTFFASIDAYVAPNIRGESFGIILAEAMAAGAKVVASDIQAFAAVLSNGASGTLFKNGESKDLARAILEVFANPQHAETLAQNASRAAEEFDWAKVAEDIFHTYELAITLGGDQKVSLGSENRPWKRQTKGGEE